MCVSFLDMEIFTTKLVEITHCGNKFGKKNIRISSSHHDTFYLYICNDLSREVEEDCDTGVRAKYRSVIFCTHRYSSRIIYTYKVITPASSCTAWPCHITQCSGF